MALEKVPKVVGDNGDIHISYDLNKLLNQTDKLAHHSMLDISCFILLNSSRLISPRA